MLYYSPVEGHGAVYGRPADLITLVRLGLTTEIHTENVKGVDVGRIIFSPSTCQIVRTEGSIGILCRYMDERKVS